MSILSFLGGALKPLTEMADNFHTSDDERNKAKAIILKIENELEAKYLDLESQLIKSQSAVIIAEAQSQSWIARNWRPIVMLTFTTLIVLIATGYMDMVALQAVPEELWKLLTLGIGGYMTLRSVDKNLPKYLNGRKEEE